MLLRFAPTGFFVLAIVLFGAAGVAYFLEHEGPGAVIDEPERELPELAIGKHEVTFRLRNPTWHTVRVVGAGEC